MANRMNAERSGLKDPDKIIRCARCDFKGTREERDQHAEDASHPLCVICNSRSLRATEARVCDPCVQRTRDQLNEIVTTVTTDAPNLIHYSGYYGMFGADLLVMTADGSVDGGGPDDWLTDPTPVIAVLEANSRAWRKAFSDPPSDEVASIVGCAGYLRRNLARAAAELDDFDDFVTEIRTLHSRLLHTAGLIDDPERAPAECFACGGRLVRTYRPPKTDVHRRLEQAKGRINSSAKRKKNPTSAKQRRDMVLDAAKGRKTDGLTDILECSKCGTTYTFAQYGLALRSRADECKGWVEVKLAAETARVPERTIKTWVYREREQQMWSACRMEDRRLLVWWPQVIEQAEELRKRQAELKRRRAEKQQVA